MWCNFCKPSKCNGLNKHSKTNQSEQKIITETIMGPQGPQGATGPTGTQGELGVQGEQGP